MATYEDNYVDRSNLNLKAISCERIPEVFLDNLVARKYFSQFGRVNRYILRPNKLSCTVEYDTEDEAREAVIRAGQYNMHKFNVGYAKREMKNIPNAEEWMNAEVQSELQAMAPVGYQSSNSNHVPALPMRAPARPIPAAPLRQAKTAEGITHKVNIGMKQELEALLRKPAYTDEAKFRVLDARDKLIRLTQVRTTDIKKASSIKGTCPDMCPEKERLMREFQRQVSHFEAVINNDGSTSISHSRAIKEYSRSSADQEIPLSHELRPESVLHMTMQYLLHEIADLCNDPDTSLADWYHFVWDRTRSIRKDITQQQLCSVEAVRLVEQCARFHIHCAARLVAEDYAVFDKKINAENLTKCLQTLKYMYHDLRLKQVHCDCEAEFRSYIVLLNLGNANFLWELKQLPQHIQNAPQIKRAIAFYNALQDNNYVRFFALIRAKETSYLSACILLGYFNKLRFNALNVINKSCNWRKYDVYLPTEYFVKILGFEHVQAAESFLQYHGMQCDEERVMLSTPQQQDVEYSMERAFKLVESKRHVNVGECIAGQPLESQDVYRQHQPHNSFDEQGMLKQTAWLANDQSENAIKSLSAVYDKSNSIPVSNASAATTPTANIFGNLKSQTIEQPQQQATPAATKRFSFGNYLQTNNVEQKPSINFQSNIFGGFAKQNQTSATSGNLFAKPFSFQTVQKEEIAKEQVEAEEQSDDVESVGEDASIEKEFDDEDEFYDNETVPEDRTDFERFNAQDIENEVALEEEEEAAAIQRKEAEAAALQAQLRNELEKHVTTLYDVLLCSVIENVVQSEFDECLALNDACYAKAQSILMQNIVLLVKDIALEELQHVAHKRTLLRRAFDRWLTTARRKAHKRHILESLPVFASTETREQQLQKVYMPTFEDNLHMMKRYRYGTACDFNKLLWDDKYNLKHSTNIFAILNKQLPTISSVGQLRVRKYFKLLITLPAEHEEMPGLKSFTDKLLEQILSSARGAANMSHSYVCAMQQNVAVCVRKITGAQILNEQGNAALQGECDHADAVICVMSSSYAPQTRLRLQQLFKRGRNFKKLPLALFVLFQTQHVTATDVLEDLDVSSLPFKSELKAVKCFIASDNMQEQFEAALKFVARNVDFEATQLLTMQKLSSWLDNGIGAELWQRWQQSWQENPAFRLACSKPMQLVRLYNIALQRLHDIVELNLHNYAEFSSELQEFVPQLPASSDLPLSLEHFPSNWKQLYKQNKICNLLQMFKMPVTVDPSCSELDDVNALGNWCMNYALNCLKTDDELVLEKVYEYIRNFLLNCDLSQLSFLTIIRDLANLKALLILNQKTDLPQYVIYAHEAMLQYLTLPWWLNCGPVADIDMSTYCLEQTVNDNEEDEAEAAAFEMHNIIKNAERISEKSEQNKTIFNKSKSTVAEIHNNDINLELNKSLHNFEVSKLLGAYTMPANLKRTVENDIYEHDNLNNKRKCSNNNDVQHQIDAVIAKAMALIEKLETS